MARSNHLIILTFLLALLLTPEAHAAEAHRPVRVEVWHVGDDGLTLKVSESIESAFRGTPTFSLAPADEGEMIVTIPTNVRWKRSKAGVRIMSEVEFRTRKRVLLRRVSISCTESKVSVCAAQTVEVARNLASALRARSTPVPPN
jgi:hypothetical protein